MDIKGKFVRLLVWTIGKANAISPSVTILPLKWAGIVSYAGKREKLRLAIRHDTDWDNHIARSWNQKAFWYHRTGTKTLGTLQIADLQIEWRLGRKVNN